jgi:adenine-specific DNA-methyltransferase
MSVTAQIIPLLLDGPGTRIVPVPSSALVPVREAGVVYTKPWIVEVILDLAGYTDDRRLWELVALEPSAGDGAFLRAMVRRLVSSCRRHGVDVRKAAEAIRAFEIDPLSAAQAVEVMRSELGDLGVRGATASHLAQGWIRVADFLEASLGFPVADFVVGNPPYIRLEEIPAAKAQFYRSSFGTMCGRADIYVAFYQAALMQLKPGGVCAYICADRWLLNDYGRALRSYITTEGYNVRYVLEAHDVDAFDSEVSAYPAVTVISRAPQGPVVVAKALPGIESAPREHVVQLISCAESNGILRAARFNGWFHGDEPWPCSSPDRLRALKLLEATCGPLESLETGTRIGIGVATGADDVYVISGKCDIESDRLLPLAMAYDLIDGRVQWSGHHLANPWDENGLVDLSRYPQLAAYLAAHRQLLCKRNTAKKSSAERWHKTIDRVNLSLTFRPKLYIADIKDRLLPALDEGRTYPHHNLYWITSDRWDLRVLGGLLLSAVGEFFIHCYGVRMRGGYMRFQAQYLRRIRVPAPDTIPTRLKQDLRRAFDTQDRSLATCAALESYGIATLPD